MNLSQTFKYEQGLMSIVYVVPFYQLHDANNSTIAIIINLHGTHCGETKAPSHRPPSPGIQSRSKQLIVWGARRVIGNTGTPKGANGDMRLGDSKLRLWILDLRN